MTPAEAKAHKEQRQLLTIKVVTAGALLAIAIAVGSFVLGLHNSADITNVTRRVDNPCQRATDDPSDRIAFRECATVRRAIARREPLANPCISYQRVTGHKGANCQRDFRTASATDAKSSANAPSVPDQSPGGDADQTPSQGNQPSGPSGGQQPTGPHEGGSEGAPAPGNAGSEGPAAPPPSPVASSPAPPEPEPDHPVAELLEPVTAPIHEVVCSLPVALCP